MKMRRRSLPWHHRVAVVTTLLALSSLKLIASTVLTNSDPGALAKAIEQGDTVTLANGVTEIEEVDSSLFRERFYKFVIEGTR